jgi:RNase adaptor protein for sRNA GlmZ degradation
MQDPRARRAVSAAVEDILAYGRRQLRQEDRNRRDVAMSVCCQYGTHRSVSIAERIAQRLMGLRLGVRVKVRHVHRQRGSKEAH